MRRRSINRPVKAASNILRLAVDVTIGRRIQAAMRQIDGQIFEDCYIHGQAVGRAVDMDGLSVQLDAQETSKAVKAVWGGSKYGRSN